MTNEIFSNDKGWMVIEDEIDESIRLFIRINLSAVWLVILPYGTFHHFLNKHL